MEKEGKGAEEGARDFETGAPVPGAPGNARAIFTRVTCCHLVWDEIRSDALGMGKSTYICRHKSKAQDGGIPA